MSPSELAEQADAVAKERKSKRSFPKTHTNYWKARLEHRSYTRNENTFEVAEWSVRIHFKGNRKSFDLESANKEEAASKARDIYLSLMAKGWAGTLAELSPPAMVPVDARAVSPTVGQFLAEVERTSSLKPKTFRRYAQYFRMLTAQIQGIESDASRYDYRNGGLEAWREQIDAVRLSSITPLPLLTGKLPICDEPARINAAGLKLTAHSTRLCVTAKVSSVRTSSTNRTL